MFESEKDAGRGGRALYCTTCLTQRVAVDERVDKRPLSGKNLGAR